MFYLISFFAQNHLFKLIAFAVVCNEWQSNIPSGY